jgi:tetratricopeptide (TPR) repeat protein
VSVGGRRQLHLTPTYVMMRRVAADTSEPRHPPKLLKNHLAALEASGLIMPARFEPEAEYLFRHALLQQASYNSLLRSHRRQVHQAVGEALEAQLGNGAPAAELAPVLARHFSEAGDEARALRYHSLAGRTAAESYANAEALHHLGSALTIGLRIKASPGVIADLYLRIGRAYELSADDSAALANYEAMQAWATATGQRQAQFDALAARATIYVKPSVVQNLPHGFDLSQEALALARDLGNRAAEARVLWNLLIYYLSISDNERALEHGEAALAIAREDGLLELEAYVLTDIIKVYFQHRESRDTWGAIERARSIWRELGIRNMLADNLATTSIMHIVTGRYDEALAISQEASEVSRSIGNLWNQAYALHLVDLIYFDRGQVGRAIEVANEGLRLSVQAGFAEGISQAEFDLALIYAYMAALPLAFDMARRVQERTRHQPGAGSVSPSLGALMAYLQLVDGRPAEARATLVECGMTRDRAELAGQFYMVYYLVALVEVELAVANGQPEAAVAWADDVVMAVVKPSARLFLADAHLLRARASRAAGRDDEAEAALLRARAEAEALGGRRAVAGPGRPGRHRGPPRPPRSSPGTVAPGGRSDRLHRQPCRL